MVNSPHNALHQVLNSFDNITINDYQRLLNNYLFLDTACQHTCCSTKWFEMWENAMNSIFKLSAKKVPNQEPFEFGHGPAQYSHMHAYIPATVDHTLSTTCLIGTSIINSMNDIPMLGSHGLLSKMRAIIDLPGRVLRLEGVPGSSDVPIVSINGHIAIKITNLPDHVNTCHETWSQLGEMSDHEDADVELITTSDCNQLKPIKSQRDLGNHHGTSATMDSTLEAPGGILFQCRVLPRQSSCASGALGTACKDLAGVSRSNVDDREEYPAEEGNFRMSTRSDTTIGKQRRQVQQVPHMRKAVERGPGSNQWVEPLRRERQRPPSLPSPSSSTAANFLDPRSLQQSGWAYRQPRHPSCLSYSKKIAKAADKGTRPKASSKRDNRRQDQEEEMSDDWDWGWLPLQQVQTQHAYTVTKKGHTSWILGHLRSSSKIYDKEIHAYECLPTHNDYVNSQMS